MQIVRWFDTHTSICNHWLSPLKPPTHFSHVPMWTEKNFTLNVITFEAGADPGGMKHSAPIYSK
jgi:hypothetical protein